jgi:hypothetical protein
LSANKQINNRTFNNKEREKMNEVEVVELPLSLSELPMGYEVLVNVETKKLFVLDDLGCFIASAAAETNSEDQVVKIDGVQCLLRSQYRLKTEVVAKGDQSILLRVCEAN